MSEQPGVADRPGEDLQLGIVPLRPLALPDLLRGAVEAVRRNKSALLGVGLLVAVVTELSVWLATVLAVGDLPAVPGPALDWADTRAYLIASLIRLVVSGVLALLLHAVVNVVVPRAVFGHAVGMRAALEAGSPRLPALLGAFALTAVLVGGLAGLMVLTLFAGAFGVLLMFAPFAAVVYLAVAFLFASSVVVVEGAGPVAALHRSRALVHVAGWWRVLGVMVVVNLGVGLASTVVATVFDAISGGGAFAEALAAIAVGTVLTPVALAAQALLYVDHRCRGEGIEGLWRTAG